MDRAETIERSLRCLVLGLLGLLPVIGLPMAVTAILEYGRVRLRKGPDWNPAQRHLSWGFTSAVCGILMTLLLLLVTIGLVQLASIKGY
jgi:hypothetical protein